MFTTLEPKHLVALLASPEEKVRGAAVAALARLGSGARAALVAGLTHPDAQVRHACAALHAQLEPSAAFARSAARAPRFTLRPLLQRVSTWTRLAALPGSPRA